MKKINKMITACLSVIMAFCITQVPVSAIDKEFNSAGQNSVMTIKIHNGTGEIKVNGRADKIQFIDSANSTWTYHRMHNNVSIVSYNADGAVVDNLSRELVFEIWTINNVTVPVNVDCNARIKFENQWKNEAVAFVASKTNPIYNDKFIHAEVNSNPVAPGKVFTVTVETEPDVRKVQLVLYDGTTRTYNASETLKNDKGNLVFTCKAVAGNEISQNIKVFVKSADNTWKLADTLTAYIEDTCTVTFIDYNGNTLKTETMPRGGNVIPPEVPAREGFKFIGWDKNIENITSDTVITAVYEKLSSQTESKVKVSSIKVKEGTKTADVIISIENNPGFAGMQFNIEYDDIANVNKVVYSPAFSSGAQITDVDITDANTSGKKEHCLTFLNFSKNVTENGTYATVTFEFSDNVKAGDIINITGALVPENTFNSNYEDITFDFVGGQIEIIK